MTSPTSPVELYGEALRGASPARVRYADGRALPLDVPRWASVAAPGDDGLLARCGSATLDVGCGPGRLVRALLGAGIACTGVDVAPVAVELARTGGGQVLHASVHDALLDGTRWSTILLADGNIGIGGDPVTLLRRVRSLLAPGGRVLVELDPPATATARVQVRLESDDRTSDWFPWAHVSVDDAAVVAGRAGLVPTETWEAAGRHFAALAAAVPASRAA